MNKIKGLEKLEAIRASLPTPEAPTPEPTKSPEAQKDVVLDALIDLWVAVNKCKTDVPLPVRSAMEKANKIIRPLLHA